MCYPAALELASGRTGPSLAGFVCGYVCYTACIWLSGSAQLGGSEGWSCKSTVKEGGDVCVMDGCLQGAHGGVWCCTGMQGLRSSSRAVELVWAAAGVR